MSFDKCISDVRNISCGVPHGSILGPKLFIRHINDMFNISNLVKCIIFADDTNICHAKSNISGIYEILCSILETLCVRFEVNKLIVNITKPSMCYLEVVFSTKKSI